MLQLNRDELIQAYTRMKTIRDFEERLHVEFGNGEIPGFVHLYAGEEASGVGMCQHLKEEIDYIASTHRGHGHCIAKGCDVTGMMREIFGKSGGLCNGKGGSMHIADLEKGMMGANGIVGGGPPLICGAALSAKTLGTGGVAVAFVGDGGSNQGTTFEAMNLASVWKLPAIFVFENNGYAESTPAHWSVSSGDIVKRAQAFGMPGVQVNGFDFFEVHEAAGEAVERARNGEGPTLIEVKLTRFYGHFEGDAMLYRGKGEVDKFRAENDCLKIFRNRVTETGLLEAKVMDDIDVEVAKLIDEAVADAKSAPYPEDSELMTDVYISY